MTNFSIKRPVFTIVTMTLFLLLGAISLVNIPLKLIPDIDPPIGAVVTSYPEASPQEVMNKVSKPLESTLATLPGLKNISSISMEGSSMVILEFSWATSIDEIENDIISRMNQAPMPSDAGNPRFLKFDPSQLPIIQLSITSDEEDDLSNLVHDLELELVKINGIASIDVMGDAIDEIVVELDQDALEIFELEQSDIVSMIQAHNVTAPGSTIKSGELELTTRVLFEMNTLEDIEGIVLSMDPLTGMEVTVSDVGNVSFLPERGQAITRTNQESSVMLSVQQQSDANTAQVSRAFNDRLNELLAEAKYNKLNIAVLFDQGEYIEKAVSSVSTALIAGGVIAMLVLFAFLRSLKTPLIIGIAIPFSVIVTFVLLFFTNFSLNIMTLGGLALGIGMLVDNSIVVIENIYRHLSMQKESRLAALEGTKEVAAAITASTLTTISVFLPVVFIAGIVGNLFREFALTVSFSLIASLAVALTIVPMIASRILKAPKVDVETKRQQSPYLQALDRSVRWTLKHRVSVLLLTILLLAGGALGVANVGVEFIPTTDEGYFQIDIEMERGTPLEVTLLAVEKVENVLDGEGLIENYMSVTGSGGARAAMFGSTSSHEAFIYVSMVPIVNRTLSTVEYAESIRRNIERAAPEAEVKVQLQASFGGAPNTYSFNVLDSDPNRLEEVVIQLEDEFRSMSEFNEVTHDLSDTIREIQFVVDEEAARENGFVPVQLAQLLHAKMRGVFATQIVTDDNEIYGVHVRYAEEHIEDVDVIGDLLFRSPLGDYVPLREMISIVEGEGPATLNRINQESAVQFSLQYKSQYNLNGIDRLVQETVNDMDLPEETTIDVTGDQVLLEDAINDLTLALILALIFVYLVLAAQFESFKYPFVIMFSVPLVLIGVAIGLTVTLTPISVMAFIGLIVLAGIVVNNAIVLVDYINQRKAAGLRSYEAIIEGVKDRARPILMTALTTILGLIPLSLGIGEGAEIQQPLAITVIGGMVSSTFLSLFFIPVIYSFFDLETRRMNRKYITPDGELIPAYLIDDRKVHNNETRQSKTNYQLVEKNTESIEDFGERANNEELYYNQEHDEEISKNSQRNDEGVTREELLEILEDLIQRNRKKKD